MRRVTFDIESDGLLDEISVIHCITLLDRDNPKRVLMFNGGSYADGSFAPHDGSIEDGLAIIENAADIVGHNIIGYDIPAIQKLHPRWKPKGRIRDTLTCACVIWTNLREKDAALIAKGRLPEDFAKKGFFGTNKLGAWGYRLGTYKGDFDPADYINPATNEKHTWKSIGFTAEMAEYALQDPVVTERLMQKIESKGYTDECLELESRVKQIIFKQEERGFAVSMERIDALVAKLQTRHAAISGEVGRLFLPWYAPVVVKGTALHTVKKPRREWTADENGPVTRVFKDKVTGDKSKVRGHYTYFEPGATFTKIKQLVFNPDSREHIADRLIKTRGWKPTAFTPEGAPQIDETILEALPWPEAKPLAEYLMVAKRLGQVATGKKSWLKFAVRCGIYGAEDGDVWRIHGRVNTNGAVTGRMTHDNPNVAQTPKVGTPYGEECRACFIATPGLVLVGCDAEGLELRMLAHFMAKYDGGEYVLTVVHGKKEDGTDVHTVNMRAAGLNTRDNAKTFIYALLYGAGDFKLGSIVYDDFTDATRARFLAQYTTKSKRTGAIKRLGTARRARIMSSLPAFGKLVEAVKAAAKKGYLIGLDGRHLHVRSEHSALNTLLQSGGALVMKRSLVILDDALDQTIRVSGVEAHHVANVHDEFQMETIQEKADEVGRLAADSIRRAGEYFKLRCPLSGSYGIGHSWAETH